MTATRYILCVSLLALCSCRNLPEPKGQLYVIQVGESWGYIDATGSVIIKPRFGYANPFVGERARVVRNKRWVLIDKAGRVIQDSPYEQYQVRNFSEGLAAVDINDKWGYVDEQLRIVIPPQFDDGADFGDGLAAVNRGARTKEVQRTLSMTGRPQVSFTSKQLVGGKWGYIDRAGNLIVGPRFDDKPEAFHEGLAKISEGGKWGYIDRSGTVVIKPQFELAGDFKEGHTWVGRSTAATGASYGIIDRAGKTVIPYDLESSPEFSEGVAAIKRRGNKWGYIDIGGKVIIEPRFQYALPFKSELAAVKIEDKWGYIDKTGKVVIEARFDAAEDFDGDLAVVTISGLVGYINRSGSVVISPQFSSAEPFEGELAHVEFGDGSEHGYINRKGTCVWRATRRK